MLENWSDKVVVYWDYSFGPLSFFVSFLLIIIILKHTPESTKTYASIILSITIADCLSLLGTFMSSARVIPRGTQQFMVFRGACIYCFPNDPELRSKFCLFFFAMRVQFHVLYHLILIFSYIYRVIVITNPLKRIDKRKTVYIGLSTYSILHFLYFSWVCFQAFQPMEVINREISKYEPSIVGSNATYNGIVNLKDPSQIVFYFLSVYTPLFVLFIAVICQWRIKIFSKQYKYSESIKKQQQALEMVFLAQTVGPLLSFVTSIFYLLINEMGVSTNTIVILENIMSRPAILMNIVNPIITLFYIAPYRMAFFKWFHISSVRVVRVPPLIDNQSTKTQENENGVKAPEEVIEQPVV